MFYFNIILLQMKHTFQNSKDKQAWFILSDVITDMKKGVFFSFLILKLSILFFYSFGRQLGGRRGCECITLEPSEMIVVS